MYILKKTALFDTWLKGLRDITGKGKILVRIKRTESGNLGDYKALGSGLYEMRIDYGPGYRLYFMKDQNTIILLLSGGIKSSQEKDIKKALNMIKEITVHHGNKNIKF